MSHENFGNPEYIHPEAAEPLEMQHAEQVTLRHLMSKINNVVGIKYALGNYDPSLKYSDLSVKMYEKGLRSPDDSKGAARVSRREKGTSSWKPDQIGLVERNEPIDNNPIGEWDAYFLTQYFILDAPDGLQVEKRSLFVNPRIELETNSPEEFFEKVEEREKAEAIEKEMGLSFVSEKETRDVLRFLDDLER